jgi:gliding motility-associated-like protein
LDTTVNICTNQTYQLPSGATVSTAGTYIDTIRNNTFLDSVIQTLHLIVNDVSYANTVDSIEAGQSYTLPSGLVVNTTGIYQSVLMNSLGCDSIITTELKLKKPTATCLKLFNNAITPNGDGINDSWVLYSNYCFKKLEVNVYNRYGSLVYHADDYKNDWKGTYKNKSLPDGTYYFVINLRIDDDRKQVFKGNVTIIR